MKTTLLSLLAAGLLLPLAAAADDGPGDRWNAPRDGRHMQRHARQAGPPPAARDRGFDGERREHLRQLIAECLRDWLDDHAPRHDGRGPWRDMNRGPSQRMGRPQMRHDGPYARGQARPHRCPTCGRSDDRRMPSYGTDRRRMGHAGPQGQFGKQFGRRMPTGQGMDRRRMGHAGPQGQFGKQFDPRARRAEHIKKMREAHARKARGPQPPKADRDDKKKRDDPRARRAEHIKKMREAHAARMRDRARKGEAARGKPAAKPAGLKAELAPLIKELRELRRELKSMRSELDTLKKNASPKRPDRRGGRRD